MATLASKLVPWAAKEAEEFAAKAAISLEEAAQKIIDKYGPKAVGTTVEQTRPSLSSAVRGKGFTMQEPSIPKERALVPISRESKELVPVGPVRDTRSINLPSKLPRELEERGTSEYKPYGESTPLPRLGKSDRSASEDFESSLGELDTGIYPEVKIPRAAKIATGVGTTVAAGEILRRALSSPADKDEISSLPDELPTTEAEGAPAAAPAEPTKSATTATGKAPAGASKAPENKTEKELRASTERRLSLMDDLANLSYENPRDQAAIQAQRDRAYELYDKAETRNDWLQVAETLAQALAQFGAAQAGMRSGQAMVLPQMPRTDYGARTARAERRLERELRTIEQDEEAKERAAKETRGVEEFKIRSQLEKEKIGSEELREKLRAEERAAEKAEKAARPQKMSEIEEFTYRENYKAAKQEAKAADQQLQNAQKAASLITPSLDSKTLKKQIQSSKGVFQGAGISEDEVNSLIDSLEPSKWFESKKEEAERVQRNKQKVQDVIVEPVRQRRDSATQQAKNLLESFQQMQSGRQPTAQPIIRPISQPTGQSPTSSGTVKIQAPDGTVAEVPADKAQKYIDKGGKIVQ